MKAKKERKISKALLTMIIITSVVAGISLIAGGGYLTLTLIKNNRKNNDPAHVDPPAESGGLVFQKNRSLYDKNGNILRLRGVNAGNVLVSEGWISPYSCGALVDDQGKVVTDKDGNVEYPDLTQEEVYAAYKSNPNLTEAQKAELINLYQRNWMSADDFRIIKEDFHMNAIRLPFYWRDILNDDYSRKPEAEAFAYLDWFMEQCTANGIYCILDLHGAVKTQNGYEHSGSKSQEMLWDNEEAIVKTCDIWSYVATHYKNNPLGDCIATYDLLNEPCGNYQGETQDNCFPVFNRLYKAIRDTGDNHVITIEGCWFFNKFINPNKYGWKNIQYQIHLYCWDWLGIDMDTFYTGMEASKIGHNYDVPYLVGEFTFFSEDAKVWEKWLDYYERLGYSWTLWTYKKTVVGWWNDNWGLYNYKMFLDNKTHEQKPDLRTATYDELREVFEKSNTTQCYVSKVGEIVSKYLEKYIPE